MTLPMMLTIGRIVLAPVFFLMYSAADAAAGTWAIVLTAGLWLVFILIEVSDLLDGHFARALNQVSEIGKVLDPFADSISRLTYFVCFAGSGYLPMWILLILIYRDVGVSYVRIMASGMGTMMGARLSGKVKAWVYAVCGITGLAVFTLFKLPVLEEYGDAARIAAFIAFVIAALVAAWSLWDYTVFFVKNRRKPVDK